MKHFKFVLGLLLAFGTLPTAGGCGGNEFGPSPLPGTPQCSALRAADTQTVRTCAATQTRGYSQCALCDYANMTLACAFNDRFAVCVDNCSACDHAPVLVSAPLTDPGQLIKDNVYVCSPLRYRQGSWCATCSHLNMTLATSLCDKDGFCNPVVCVASCDACEVAP